MDYYNSYNLRDIRKRQEDEVINEDRRIAKMELDNQYAFLRRIKETEPVPKPTDRKVEFRIEKYTLDMKNELEAVIDELERDMNGEAEGVASGIGKFDSYWNEFVAYLKNFKNTNRLTQADLNKIWELIDDNVVPLMENITDLILAIQSSGKTVVIERYSNFEQIKKYIEDRNLKQTTPGAGESRTFKREDNEEEDLEGFEDAVDDGDGDEEEDDEDVQGPIIGDEGYGRRRKKVQAPRKRKPMKKMDSEEMQVYIVGMGREQKKKNEQSLKHPKKETQKPSLPFNDMKDNHYID